MNRREFLRTAGLVGGAVIGGPGLLGFGSTAGASTRAASRSPILAGAQIPGDSVLNHPAAECPVDTVIVLTMENRSFDHYFGHLATDQAYLDAGRRAYGKEFAVNGTIDIHFRDVAGAKVPTTHIRELGDEPNPFRGCLHNDPGHGWGASRKQRDNGFLGPGTGNDRFAIGYYLGEDIPVQSSLARRFTVMDRHHAALLGPTWPNRQYLYSAQAEGYKTSPKPLDVGAYSAPTIFDRLNTAGVPVAEYFINVPVAALWGTRLNPNIRSLDQYFLDAPRGELPAVTFITPGMGTSFRTDDHPQGDITLGQRFIQAIFSTFVRSPQWQRGMFVLTYDEHGGFYDHVKPPVVPDSNASKRDGDNFGQAGFRVPSVLASPYARTNYVDHTLYDHTSILRFLEWRFLGAPPQGPGRDGDKWFLTERDRNANNYGASLRADNPDPEVDLETPLLGIPPTSRGCDDEQRTRQAGKDNQINSFDVSDRLEGLAQQVDPDGSTFTPWLRQTDVRGLPTVPDDRPR
jgi:phospholipase C